MSNRLFDTSNTIPTRCPKCGRKVLIVLRDGIKTTRCSCGHKAVR